MDRRRAAGALLALAACIACSTAAPTASNQTALDLFEGPSEGCYYNFQHYGEGDRIMTNEPCLNCTCHNRMLMCYLKVCPFTKPIGQDCTIEKRADQCCPIVTCPDVPVDLLTSTSTSSPAEYGATGLGKVDKYGCSINGKYFPEGSKVPPTPNKPCEHCYCIRNMTTCVMQECTLHVDGCTPIYHKDVCCPVRYSCDHLEDEMLLLDDMTTTVRPTPGFLLTTTTMPSVTQISQNCVHDDQIFADGALIKTEIACEHCYCMKGDIVCVVQECGTPMENEGKNCTSLPPRQGQCCPDTYICEGDELLPEPTTSVIYEELTTLSPPRRVEGSGYRNEPDEPYTEIPAFEGSGEEHATTLESSDVFTPQKQTPQIIDETFTPTEESYKPSLTTIEPDKEQNTVPDDSHESTSDSHSGKTTLAQEATTTSQPNIVEVMKETDTTESKTTSSDYLRPSEADSFISKDDEFITTTETVSHYTKDESSKITEMKAEAETTETDNIMEEVTTQKSYLESSSSEPSTVHKQDDKTTTFDVLQLDENSQSQFTTPEIPKDISEDDLDKHDTTVTPDKEDKVSLMTTTESRIELSETTSVNPVENEIDEDVLLPGRIPGEGDCLLNGVTYKNSTNVPNINNCHSSCKCVSSIIKCDPIICSPPPEHMDNMNDCQPIYDTPDACCPTYICHSRETIPPESHSQMSGTESPKPLLESECHGNQCQPHKSKPIPTEPCNSEGCESVMENQEKECKNGVCENAEASTGPPPVKHPEDCIGDSCMHSAEICTDGKCQPSPTSQTICDNENGCQPAEACEGSNCASGTESTVAKEERPICKDSEECKVTDISGCEEGSQCDTSTVDTQIHDKNIIQTECKEESCKRKDQPEENKAPSECSGSTCIAQKTDGESGDFTTESAIKDQVYKESTTEIITDNYSKLPESENTPTDETQKVEAITESQDILPEHSTAKSEESPVHDMSQTVTENGESYTDSYDSYVTKVEETITEMYNKPETEATYDKEQVTESIEGITKETITESPYATQYDKHPSDLPKEDINDMPPKPFESSTETLDIEPHNEKEQEEVTSNVKDFTQTQEIDTKPTYIPETSTKVLEIDMTEKEYTSKEEDFTEMPKQDQTTVKTQDSVNTESQQNVFMTESSVPLSPEITTEDHIELKVKDDEVKSTGDYDADSHISVQSTTEQFVPSKESSEQYETKLDETATQRIDADVEIDRISTENPIIFTEVIPTDTATHELDKFNKETEPPEVTEASVQDQENLNKQTEMFDTVTDKQAYTTPNEIQEHVTSVTSIIHATQPATTEENFISPTQDISDTQKDELTVPEYPIKDSTTIAQEFDMKEITTLQPDMAKTNAPEITDVNEISSQTVSDKLEEHTGTPIEGMQEVTTLTPEKAFQGDTVTKVPSIIEPHENDIPTNVIPIDEGGLLGTTISSISSDKDQDISTKYSDMESGMETTEEVTSMPEVHSTKSEESSSVYDETMKKTSEKSSTGKGESLEVTTESLVLPHEHKDEVPHTDDETQEPSIEDHTIAPTIPYTEGYGDSGDKTIPVSIDETKTKEEPQYTTPETVSEFTEKQDTESTDDHITENVEDKTKGTDSSKEPQKPTEPSVSNEMEVQNIETTTHSQDTETKLATELQTDQEIFSTPTHVMKDEKGQTESPMSLITEPSGLIHSVDADDSSIDKTTQTPQEKIQDEEETKRPDHSDTKPHVPDTEYPQTQEIENIFDSKTTPQTHPEKERQPESQETTIPQEYTTVKILDIYNEEKSPPMTTTEVAQKLLPTTEYQDSVKPDSGLYPTDVKHESSEIPVKVSSEESFATEHEEISTRYPEISGSITTMVDEHKFEMKPENIPVKDPTSEDTTEQPQNNVDITTAKYLIEEQEDTQQGDKVDDNKDSEPTIPTAFTTKYPETLEESQQTNKPEPNKQEELFPPEQPMSEHEKPTEVLPAFGEKDITTPGYQDSSTMKEELMTDLPEPHLITGDISSTESSEMLPSEESNRRTLSPIPDLETLQPEQYTTEKKIITELPEKVKPEEIGQTDMSQETSTDAPAKESATSEPVTEEFDHVTSVPAATESNIPVVTETVTSYHDERVPVVTESTETHASEGQDIISKPVTELNPITDIQTEQPFQSETEKDTISDKTTAHGDLIGIPIATMPAEIPSGHTVAHELPTESSIQKETESSEPTVTEASVLIDTESETSIPIETETSVSKAPEPSTSKESELLPPKVTEASVSKETGYAETEIPKEPQSNVSAITEASIPQETESAVSELTEPSVARDSEPTVSEVTEAFVHEVTETSITDSSKPKAPEVSESSQTEIPEAAVSEITEASTPESSEPKVPETTAVSEPKTPESTEASEPHIPEVTSQPQVSQPEETEASQPEITEGSRPEVTEASQPEVTEASQPEVTGASQSKVTESSQPEVTEAPQSEVNGAPQSKVTETSKPEVTEDSQAEATEVPQSEITEAYQSEVTEASQSEVNDASVPEITKAATSEVTEASVPEKTEATVSDLTKISEAERTEASEVEITEPSVPKETETSVPKETESEIMDKEPGETTSKPKDEKSEIPVEESPTLEPIHSSSETTPYLVELQEHTTKVDEDISSVTLTEEDRTKAPEIYHTERGDQPLDNIPDKFTQENFQEELTTKETFTKKDEQVTTLPPEQASEYTEILPDKTDVATEEIPLSSESPISTLLNAQITTQAVPSGEESITITPTVSAPLDEHDKHTTADFGTEITSDKKEKPLVTEKIPEQEVMHEETSSEDAFIPVATKATTIKTPEESTTQLPVEDNKYSKPDYKPSEPYSPTTASEMPKPEVSEIQPTEELPSPDFAPTGSSGYGQEPDYVEEDQAFGPGTCRYGGKVYVSAQQIPRDDPCDFCFCFRSDIICLQQSCPPPIHGCHEEPIQGFCCPRYECPVSMATTLNVTTTTTTTTTTLPPHFLPHAYKGAAQRRGCQIKGHSYKVGEVVRASSGPCLHCTCGGDGQMKCDPKACTPEPMLRQMIAAAVSAKRRR